MARVNIYLPDDLADRARNAELNISAVARSALEDRLAGLTTSAWLDEMATLPPLPASHEDVLIALDETREEMGDFVER